MSRTTCIFLCSDVYTRHSAVQWPRSLRPAMRNPAMDGMTRPHRLLVLDRKPLHLPHGDADRPRRGVARRRLPLAAVFGARDHDRDGQRPGAQARQARLHVARSGAARGDVPLRFPDAAALPAQEVRSRQPDRRGRRAPRAGARTTCARPTRAGSALGEEAGSEPNVSASLREIGQDPARVLALAQSDEIGRAYDAATAEAKQPRHFRRADVRHRAARFSGATTGWRRRALAPAGTLVRR